MFPLESTPSIVKLFFPSSKLIFRSLSLRITHSLLFNLYLKKPKCPVKSTAAMSKLINFSNSLRL